MATNLPHLMGETATETSTLRAEIVWISSGPPIGASGFEMLHRPESTASSRKLSERSTTRGNSKTY